MKHYNDVGISINVAVDLETQSRNVLVPPLDIAQFRQCSNRFELVFISSSAVQRNYGTMEVKTMEQITDGNT